MMNGGWTSSRERKDESIFPLSTGDNEPFSWRHFLNTARNLSQSTDEASLRTAVSRAYYAAFHEARAYLARFNKLEQGSEHEKVWRAFDRPTDRRQYREIWTWGTRLRKARVEADYHLEGRLDWISQCSSQIRAAEKIIELVASLPQ